MCDNKTASATMSVRSEASSDRSCIRDNKCIVSGENEGYKHLKGCPTKSDPKVRRETSGVRKIGLTRMQCGYKKHCSYITSEANSVVVVVN
ncbi:Hypothetical predicted protein [Octopus vulgaris]|uniref:Uncharacterized protein n=1 Tax=Octopus vulgaris TaxID=6645 RepID=A0AA36AMQ8_OCTVU|nr:Hypothetical predicted protein [Octopus vulgaris]